jgi:CRISPR system Cascade subunit CasD
MGAGTGLGVKALVMRFDAPLVSFGAPMVDQNGFVQQFPALSMLAGLLGNALGMRHRDSEALAALQDRIRYAARIDRRGVATVDYQTVDLALPWMRPEDAGWTTRGQIASREGAAKAGTHQRYRHYREDSIHTVALTLTDDRSPTVEDLESALREPARPLFIGRKCCLPASHLLVAVIEAPSLVEALATSPRASRADDGPLMVTWWDGDDDGAAEAEELPVAVTDERDWHNQIHGGRRLMRLGRVDPPASPHA